MQSSKVKKVVETCYRYYVAESRSQKRFTPMCLLRLQDVTVDVIIVSTETQHYVELGCMLKLQV